MFDLLTTQRQVDSLSNSYILLGYKFVRNIAMSGYLLFGSAVPCPCHSYFENNEDDGEEDDRNVFVKK